MPVGFRADFDAASTDIRAGILVLPDGADRYDALRTDNFCDYAIQNWDAWFSYVNGPAYGRGTSSLYLVTGCKKTTSWGMASFRCHSEHRGISVELKAAMLAGGDVSVGHSWMTSCPATTRTGPPSSGSLNEIPLQNQCIFLSGYTISKRNGVTQKLGLSSPVLLDTNPKNISPGAKSPRHSWRKSIGRGSAAQGDSKALENYTRRAKTEVHSDTLVAEDDKIDITPFHRASPVSQVFSDI